MSQSTEHSSSTISGIDVMRGVGAKPSKPFWADAWDRVLHRWGARLGIAWIAVIAFFASVVRGVPATALLSVGTLIVIGLLGLVPRLAPWLPGELVGAVDSLIRGGDFEYWRSAATAIVLTAVLVIIAIRRLERREV